MDGTLMEGRSYWLDFDFSNKERGKSISGITGNITLLLQFIVHFPELWTVYNARSGHTYSVLPHILLLFTYCLWFVYASPPINPHPKGALPFLTASCLGIVTQSSFIFMFLKSDPSAYDKITVQKCLITGFLACVTLLIATILPGEFELLVVGYICMIWTTSVFFAPLIRKVIKVVVDGLRISKEYHPQLRGHTCRVPCLILTTIHSAVWTCYGIYGTDLFIVVPYVLGVACGLIELFAILFFRVTLSVREDVGSLHELTELGNPHSLGHIDKENEKAQPFREFLQLEFPSPPSQKAEGAVTMEIQEEE